MLLYGAYKPRLVDQRSEQQPAPLPMWVVCAVCESVQPDVVANVKTPFLLETQGTSGSVRKCSDNLVTHDVSVQGKCHKSLDRYLELLVQDLPLRHDWHLFWIHLLPGRSAHT